MGALKWITANLTEKMKKEIERAPEYFEVLKMINGSKLIGVRTCGPFNQGVSCSGARWHVNDRNLMRDQPRKGSELRLHCCTLCLEVLGVAAGHPVTDCTWIKAETWEWFQGRNEQKNS